MTSPDAPAPATPPRRTRLLSLLKWALLALAGATAAGELGRYHWLLDLFVHFKLQCAASFGLCAATALWARERWLLLFALAGCLFHSWPVTALAYMPVGGAPARPPNFRLVSFNVGFWNDNYVQIGAFLEFLHADAVILLEYDNEQLDSLAPFLPSYPYRVSAAADLRFGAAILSRWPVAEARAVELVPGGAAAAHARIDAPEGQLNVFGVHLNWPATPRSSASRNAELKTLAELLGECGGSCVVAGDFNLTPWSGHFKDFQARTGWNNCVQGQGMVLTWPDQVPPLRIQIDQCLSSKEASVTRVATGPGLGSDHLPIIVDLALAER